MPIIMQAPPWNIGEIFTQLPTFQADGISWPFALGVMTICLAVIITDVARENFPNTVSWIGLIALTSLGILAVTAGNPLTLVMIWAAIDLGEFISQMRFVEDPRLSERIVISFASRLAGILILLWAIMVNASSGSGVGFDTSVPRAGLYMVMASAIRLGIFPFHLPYSNEPSLRRGFGTGLRMISAGSSLILLSRIPGASFDSLFTPLLAILVSLTGLYGAWMWLRSPDELAGRPYWLMGMGALAVASTLMKNPVGAAAWSCALILSGGVLFLASAQSRWLERILYIGAWGISALPLSITAAGWETGMAEVWYVLPILLVSQAALIAGYIRQSQRSSFRTTFENQPIWAKNAYPIGVYIVLLTILLLGLFGWDGALKLGNWIAGIIASLLTFGLFWLIPRVRILNPVRAHWVRSNETTEPGWAYRAVWGTYRYVSRSLNLFSRVLEGESGIMWTLLFLALFITVFIQQMP
jgi:hypothetical protein